MPPACPRSRSRARLAGVDAACGLAVLGMIAVHVSPGATGAGTPTLTDTRHSSTTLDLVATTGTALLALGVCLLLARCAGVLVVPLAAVGSMPLTVYTAHLLVLHLTDGAEPER